MKVGVIGNVSEIEEIGSTITSGGLARHANSFNSDDAAHDGLKTPVDNNLFTSFLNSVDTVIIAQSVNQKVQFAAYVLKASKHLYIQQPFVCSHKRLNRLIHLADEANTCLHFQQLSRHNALVKAVRNKILNPRYILVQRNYSYHNFNLLKASFEANLIFDIELLITLANSKVRKVIPVFQEANDLADRKLISLSLGFTNGCSTQLVCNTMSGNDRHEARVFQSESVIEFDFIKPMVTQVYPHSRELLYATDTIALAGVALTNPDNDLNEFLNTILQHQSTFINGYESYEPNIVLSQVYNNYAMAY